MMDDTFDEGLILLILSREHHENIFAQMGESGQICTMSRPRDFFKKPCFLYITKVNIFILNGHLEDLMKHIIE